MDSYSGAPCSGGFPFLTTAQQSHNSAPISDEDQSTPTQHQTTGTNFLPSAGPTNNATLLQVSSIQGSNHLQQVLGNTIAYSASIYTEGQLPQTNSFRITQPALIEGIRCYIDASTSPDQPTQSYRPAGIGIFFLVPQEQAARSIFMKATVADVHSVFMAEAAALALAATIAQALHFPNVTFLSDSQ